MNNDNDISRKLSEIYNKFCFFLGFQSIFNIFIIFLLVVIILQLSKLI